MMTDQFEWKCEPQAEAFILKIIDEYRRLDPFIDQLAQYLHRETSTMLMDWLDHLIIPFSTMAITELEQCGFISSNMMQSYRVYTHPGAQLPRIVVQDLPCSHKGLSLLVDSIADFLMVHGMNGLIEGSPLSPYRRCCVNKDHGISLFVIERRGTPLIEPTYPTENYIERYLEAREKWQSRDRDLEDEDEAFKCMLKLIDELVVLIGKDVASQVVLEVERSYWQSRNRAGQLQKNRQDRLGLGWANHDHHTFRSSRKHFHLLVHLFETLGFHCRERFYAGKEAGWGAQVMENPHSKLVLFLDVDLAPEELEIDFAHHPLHELKHLGTVGLWCALHGDSILKAGMHHLEAQFCFEDLTRDLSHLHIGMMKPFSNFPYLKQAFTEGEYWPVNPKRVHHLVEVGLISHVQAEQFLVCGAIGSHLENLQRHEGYKGFNRKNVSKIIKETDPRSSIESV